MESNLLGNIATLLYDGGKTADAIRILTFLKGFYENTELDFAERAAHYPVVAYNLSCCIGREGRYTEAIELCSNAIQMAVQAGQLDAFPLLLYNKGFCLLQLDNTEAGKTCITQAITIMQAMGQEEAAAWMAQDINERFATHLPITVALDESRRSLFLRD